MDMIVLLASLSGLILVIALSEPLAARLRLPVAVILAVVGMAIGASAAWFWRTEVTDALNPVALAILNLPISSEIFIYILLPVLLFQVSLTLNLRRMADDWVPILTLAVIAVIAATFIIGLALAPFTTLPMIACLLIGAIVSTTDPSAVVGIFRSTPAPQRLARIVEGESLLNDAAAIALFSVFVTAVATREAEPDIPAALWRLPYLIAAGALVGVVMGRIAVAVMGTMKPWPAAQALISIALPFATMLFTDQIIDASGVVAVVAAGMTMNYFAPGRVTPPSLARLRDLWELLAYAAGGLIFVLAALLIPRSLETIRPGDIGLILVTVLAAFAARAVILFALLPALSTARLSPRVERPYRIAILWGGLRGAVTLALALAVTENPAIFVEVKRQVGIVATGFVLFTLLVQGTTLRWVIGRLGLDRLSPIDKALSDQVVAVALQSVRENVAEITQDLELTPAVVRDQAVQFGERLKLSVDSADKARDILERDRVTLGLVALAGQERELILGFFRDDLISAKLAEDMLADADRLLEATRSKGRHGYGVRARKSLRPGGLVLAAGWLHNRFRIKGPLGALTARRFDFLIAHNHLLKELTKFIEARILRIHGRRVASLLHDLIRRRAEDTQRELDGLHAQFPGYVEKLEHRLIRRIVVQQEEREFDQMTADGLIGPELRLALGAETAQRQKELSKRPHLNLRVQRSDLVRAFPLFADLANSEIQALSRQMRTVYASPGAILMHKDDRPDRVWFIASGAVEAEQAGQRFVLGAGEMFGHLSLLMHRSRRARVTAMSHVTLLSLEENRFLDLMNRTPQLADAVLRSAEKRGVTLPFDLRDLPARPKSRSAIARLWQRLALIRSR